MSNRTVTYIVIAHEAFKDVFFETITIEEGEDLHDAIHNLYYDFVLNELCPSAKNSCLRRSGYRVDLQ